MYHFPPIFHCEFPQKQIFANQTFKSSWNRCQLCASCNTDYTVTKWRNMMPIRNMLPSCSWSLLWYPDHQNRTTELREIRSRVIGLMATLATSPAQFSVELLIFCTEPSDYRGCCEAASTDNAKNHKIFKTQQETSCVQISKLFVK